MKKKPKPQRQFLVKYRQTESCEVVIDAADKEEARGKFDRGEWLDSSSLSIDTIDVEFISMREES